MNYHMLYLLILLITYPDDVSTHRNSTYKLYTGQSFSIPCGESYYSADKYNLKFNGILIKKETSPFSYDVQNTELIDTGIYTCIIYKGEKSHMQFTFVEVSDLPNFKSESMTREIVWAENSIVQYNCELDSTEKYSYEWISADKSILKVGPILSINVANLYPISTIYCSILLNGQKILTKPIRIQVRTAPGAPILKSINSITRGFVITWFPPPGMHKILSTSINCKRLSDNIIFTSVVENDTTSHTVKDLDIGDNLKCNIVSRDQFGDSLQLNFNHKVEDVKYEIILHSIDAKLFKFTFRAFENDLSDAKNTFLGHNVIDLEIKVDNRKSIYMEKISPNIMLSKSHINNGNKFVLSLIDLFARSKIIGTITIFKYELKEHREGKDITVVKIADRYVEIKFAPYFGEMYDFSIINVFFITRIDETEFKTQHAKESIAYKENNTGYHVFKIENLFPNHLYIVQFQYRYADSNIFSHLSQQISVFTEPNAMANPIIKSTKSRYNAKFKYYYLENYKSMMKYCIIRVKRKYIDFRIHSYNPETIVLKSHEASHITSASIQCFSDESKTEQIQFNLKKKHSLILNKASDLFGLIGFLFFSFYILMWFLTKLSFKDHTFDFMDCRIIKRDPSLEIGNDDSDTELVVRQDDEKTPTPTFSPFFNKFFEAFKNV